MKTRINIPAIAVALLTIMLSGNALAQSTPRNEFPYSNRFSVQTGLLQDLVVDGQNIVFVYTTKRLVFDYSHGNSLDFKGPSVSSDYKDQKLVVHVPWSTGPSIGYRITPFFNVRAEFKAHRYEVNYETSGESIVKYTSYTVGMGAFYEWYPFRKKQGWTQGILIEPVVRYWPTVSTTLADNFAYTNRTTGRVESLPDYKLNFLANINIGYTFGRNKR